MIIKSVPLCNPKHKTLLPKQEVKESAMIKIDSNFVQDNNIRSN